MEIELHEFDTVPDTVFKDSFLSFTTTVSSMSGDRISDDAFKLDYETVPGTMIRDGTVRAAEMASQNEQATTTSRTRCRLAPKIVRK